MSETFGTVEFGGFLCPVVWWSVKFLLLFLLFGFGDGISGLLTVMPFVASAFVVVPARGGGLVLVGFSWGRGGG